MFDRIKKFVLRQDAGFTFDKKHTTEIWRPLLGKDGVTDEEWTYYCQGAFVPIYKSEYDFLVQVAANLSGNYGKEFTVADALRNIVSIVEQNKSKIGGLKSV